MKVINARNVHQALPRGLQMLRQYGVSRDSRNGPVRLAPFPVTTVYERPLERVCFWPQRDANPFFHLYESLWMLAGRNDLAPLLRYVKDFGKFSDDGVTLHGAYGYRWRKAFGWSIPGAAGGGYDQLQAIIARLTQDHTDRRSVLQMWDVERDLGTMGKDVPCNTMATFQRDAEGALHLTVFCRSNDIIWGAYGANAVHFGFLLEYMAAAMGCPAGTYTQVSVNWHAYEATLPPVEALADQVLSGLYAVPTPMEDPYRQGHTVALPLVMEQNSAQWAGGRQAYLDREIERLLYALDLGAPAFTSPEPFFTMAFAVLGAHHFWATLAPPERYDVALEKLARADQTVDWVQAAQQWLLRRRLTWETRMATGASGAVPA